MRGLAAITAAAAALAAAGAAPAAGTLPAQRAALVAVHRAVASGQVDRATAARYRAEIDRAARLVRGLPSGRRGPVAVALEQIGAFAGRLTMRRAAALFGELKANDRYFARHWAPRDRTDITDADGVVYRYFAGRCFEFHPLAEFGALNARVSAKDVDGTERLARALMARGVHVGSGAVGWEYYFGFGGGSAPWLSGMAQAVAAQAFARAATLLPDDEPQLLGAARGAYRAIPRRLLTNLSAGPWIRLYAFDGTPVLNAQLQAVLSLRTYATKADDAAATALATSMQEAAAAMLPSFDTGYWTYYSLPSTPSTVHYHDYVIRLLTLLAPADPRFADAAARFTAYRRQPPAFKLENGGLGELRFWLSKPATVTVYSATGAPRRLALFDGWHSVFWGEPALRGIYPIRVTAVDWAGNRASFESLPIVRTTGRRTQPTRTAAAAAAERPALAIGAGLDDPAQAARAERLGLRLVRIVVDWPFGASAPDLALAAAFQQLSHVNVLVELRAPRLPADDVGRSVLAHYSAALAQEIPGIHDVVLAPAATVATAPDYAAALVAVRDAVHAALPGVAVGPLVDGDAAPKATVLALGRLIAPTGDVDVLAFRPGADARNGEWGPDVAELAAALGQSFGAPPPVLVDGLATPTTIPAAELPAYPKGQHPEPGAVAPREQGKAYAAAITAAACSTSIAGVVVDRLVDSAAAPAPATGIVFAGGGAKTSAALVAAAAAPAQRGTVVCPGLASRAAATTLEFPRRIDPASVAAVLACARDCLYLITLDDVRGRPVTARRGTLRGGGRPLTLELPHAKLGRKLYRLDVRLVDRVNPGPVTRVKSRLLPVSRS